MEVITRAVDLKKICAQHRGSIGFVPTMGALHEGHAELIKRARAENGFCVVSVFVNPTQFLAGEDFDSYPKKTEADKKICEMCGVDLLFLPTQSELYDADEPSVCAPKRSGYILEGEIRPGHFDGVLTVVLKLLGLSCATRAYFGQKDAQQVVMIKRMVERFFMDVDIVDVPIVRNSDGLALSSRNAYLDESQKQTALVLSKSLFVALAAIHEGILDVEHIREKMHVVLSVVSIDYIAFCDRKLQTIQHITPGNTMILVAARVGATRLIDNIWI